MKSLLLIDYTTNHSSINCVTKSYSVREHQVHDLQTVAAISKKLAIPLFNELLTLGVRPIELSK